MVHTPQSLRDQGYGLKDYNDDNKKQIDFLAKTLKDEDRMTKWILSKYKPENRKEVLNEMNERDSYHLPEQLPYHELVGEYHREVEYTYEKHMFSEDKTITWYRHTVEESTAFRASITAAESSKSAKPTEIKKKWLEEARRGPIPASAHLVFKRDIYKKKWLALSYEQEQRTAKNKHVSDGVPVRSVKMSDTTIEKVIHDEYEIDVSVIDLWHDGCVHPTGTGLWDTVGGVLPYVSPNATVVKVPCSVDAPNGTWLFPRRMQEEEMFISSMITLLGTTHDTPLVLPVKGGKTFKWSGLNGFKPTVKLGGSDRFWLRIELMSGILRGNVVVGRKAAAEVLWAMSWYKTLLIGILFELALETSSKLESGEIEDVDFALGSALCKHEINIYAPIGLCAASMASMLQLDLTSLFKKIRVRLDAVWQQWRLALGTGRVYPTKSFNDALVAPLMDAEMYEKDDAVKVSLFFMYIVQRLAERNETLLDAAQKYGSLGYMQPYSALNSILRPRDGFEMQSTLSKEFYDLMEIGDGISASGGFNEENYQDALRLIRSFDTHGATKLTNFAKLNYAWRTITSGYCFAGSLTASKLKPDLLEHCNSHRIGFLRDQAARPEQLAEVLSLKPEEKLLEVFQGCKKQFWPQKHPKNGLWLSNEEGLVVVNVFTPPTREMEEISMAQPNNPFLVIPKIVKLKDKEKGQLTIEDAAHGGISVSMEASERHSVRSASTYSHRSSAQGFLDKDEGQVAWIVMTQEGEQMLHQELLEIHQLVFRVTEDNVKNNTAHMVAMRRCEPGETGASIVPITTENVRSANLKLVNNTLYNRVSMDLQEILPDGSNFKNCADDYYKIRPNGAIKPPDYTSPPLNAPIIKDLEVDCGGLDDDIPELTLYDLVIERLWGMTWH